MTDRCDGCRFFEPIEQKTVAIRVMAMDDGKPAAIGECRRNPPVPEHADEPISMWPKVWATRWCGEFKPKDAK